MRETETVVIGAGHAGLATSRCLTEAGRDHVVLDRGRVAESWRTARWDSLRLLTPNWMCRLPGWSYRGEDPEGFMTSLEFVEHLELYAASFTAPVQPSTTVTDVRPAHDGYRVTAGCPDRDVWAARNVVDLHRELAAPAGEANSLQRLAELRLHQGDRAEAGRLLRQALPRARWSLLAPHLLQRIYATLIRAAPDSDAARLLVDEATDAMANEDRCHFCDIMLAVPAAIACADVGDVTAARQYLAAGERSSTLWKGTSWQAALLEARAHLTKAEGDDDGAADLLRRAGQMFEQAGQPLDAERCHQ